MWLKDRKTAGIAVLIALVVLIGGIVWGAAARKNRCATVEDREKMLAEVLSQSAGQCWSIATESEVDGYLVSGAYDNQGCAAIAVFEPGKWGGYHLQGTVWQGKEQIITDTILLNGEHYHLIWFPGAQTEYAEITYAVGAQKPQTMRFDTSDGGVICTQIEADDHYNMKVAYYDSEGNRYE